MLTNYIILFFIFSFLGWLMEVLLCLLIDKKYINRGYLFGPYCPIYGTAVIILYILLKWISSIYLLFVLTFLICSIIEYLTSYLLEKIFKLRWWDYSDLKFNINGRICLEAMIPFAVIGTLSIKYFIPFLLKYIKILNNNIKLFTILILLSIFILDIIISTIKIKNGNKRDVTDIINNKKMLN